MIELAVLFAFAAVILAAPHLEAEIAATLCIAFVLVAAILALTGAPR